eukprot:1198127-Amphidinium_carterae.2
MSIWEFLVTCGMNSTVRAEVQSKQPTGARALVKVMKLVILNVHRKWKNRSEQNQTEAGLGVGGEMATSLLLSGSVLFLEQHGATGHSKVDATTSNILPLARSLLDFLVRCSARCFGSQKPNAFAQLFVHQLNA